MLFKTLEMQSIISPLYADFKKSVHPPLSAHTRKKQPILYNNILNNNNSFLRYKMYFLFMIVQSMCESMAGVGKRTQKGARVTSVLVWCAEGRRPTSSYA